MMIITGGAGFIGSAMIWQLNFSGIEDILVVDHLGSSKVKWRNLQSLKFESFMEKGEFRKKLRSGFFTGKKIDGIIHLGACSSTQETSKEYLLDNNFRYTAEIADFCCGRNIRMVYASSCATYGLGENGFADDEKMLRHLHPRNMYARSKHMFDLWAQKNGMLQKIAGCKYSNVFGPNEMHKGDMRSMALRAWQQICATGKIKLFRLDGQDETVQQAQRDFIYVKDAVKMTEYLFNSGAGGIFNIGSGCPVSWDDFAAAIFKVLGKELKIEYIDMPETLRGKYQYYTCADPGKIFSLGYEHRITPLAEALTDYLKNYLETGRYLGDE